MNKLINMRTNKINNFIYGLLAVFTLTLTSCDKDFLEKTDPGSGSVDGFFQGEDEFVLGVNGVYNSLYAAGYFTNFWGGNYFHMHMEFDTLSDNGVGQDCGWRGYANFACGIMTPASGGITWYKWNYGLGAISKINQLLSLIPNVNFTAGMASKWEAELKYLRGFLYADMADLYGGMPIITEPIDASEADGITRSTQAETYAQAISDLDFAIANLDTKPNKGEYGRPTKQAALMAKGLAELNQKKFSESAATLGQLVALEGADVGLVDNDDWEGLNRGTQESSKEIIWSMKGGPGNEGIGDYIPYGVAGDGDYNGWSGIKFTQNGVDAFEMHATGLPITDPASGYDADNPLEGRDPRLRKTFYFEGDEYWGGTIGDVAFGAVCCNGNLKAQSSVGIAPVFPRKTTTYTQEQKAQMATIEYGSPIDLNLFRYADALLLYAEALNEGGQTAQALAPLNQVRTRATMPAIAAGLSQAEMRAKILHERRVELYLEGKRYFDLRRQGMLMETINNNQGWDLHGGANYKSHFDLWPIPSETTDNNPNISQNPGY